MESAVTTKENEDDLVNVNQETGIARQEKNQVKPSICYMYC